MTLPFLHLLRNNRYLAKEIYNPLISFENKSPGIMGSQKIDAPFGLTLKTHL